MSRSGPSGQVGHRGRPDADIALAQQRGEAEPEQRQRKARRHLVRQEDCVSRPNSSASAAPPSAAPRKPSQGRAGLHARR